MGLFDFFRRKSAPAAKSPIDLIIDLMPGWRAATAPMNFTAAKAEYVQHYRGWNYVATSAIAKTIACMPPSVCRKADGAEVAEAYRKSLVGKSWQQRESIRSAYRRKYLSSTSRRKALADLQQSDELEPVSLTHPLVKLLRNPNGPDVSWTFWYKIALYMRMTGAAYIWCPPERGGKLPSQLWVIPSHWVRELPGERELIGEYEICPTMMQPHESVGQFGAGWFPGMGGRERRPADQIIKIAYPSPYTIIDGYAPIQAIGTWIDGSDNIDRSRVQVFHNAIFPGCAIEMDKDAKIPSQDEIDRFRAQFTERYAGVVNTRRPTILFPGCKLVPMNMTAVEMDYVNSAEQMRANILSAHGVPQSIVGLVEQTTYANAEASQYNFFGTTIKPDLMLFGQTLTEKLAKRFGEDLVVYWQDPTPNDPDFRLRKFDAMVRGKAATPNEWREAEGLSPWEYGGDDPIGSMGDQPLGWATGDQPMNEAAGMFGGMGGDQPEQGADAMDGVMGELLGGDGAATEPEGGMRSPLAKALSNGNGRNGHAH